MKRAVRLCRPCVAAMLFSLLIVTMCARGPFEKGQDAHCYDAGVVDAEGHGRVSDADRTRTIERDGAISVSGAVVRVSRSCLKTLGDLLVSPSDWYVPTSHRGIMVFPRQESVFW